jgi:hypothetical protein
VHPNSVRSARLTAPASRSAGYRGRFDGCLPSPPRRRGFLRAQCLVVWRPATGMLTTATVTGEAEQPTSITPDCLRVRGLHKPGGAGRGRPAHDPPCAVVWAMATDPGSCGPTPRSPPLSTSGRPRLPAGPACKSMPRSAPLRARGEATQMPRNRVVDDVQTACKRAVNGVQTDQAHGVGEPDPRHPDG